MTATELALRVTDAGVPLSRQAVEAIERGSRQVKTDELVGIAVALGVPLRVLMFGLGSDVKKVGPSGGAEHPHRWQKWLEGQEPPPGARLSTDPLWKVGADVVNCWRLLQEWQERFATAKTRVDSARVAGDEVALRRRIDECLDVLREIAELEQQMRSLGYHPPDLAAYVEYARGELLNEGGE